MNKKIIIFLALLSLLCIVLVSAEGIQLSCQNFPPPSFCPGGTTNIIVNGTDANGCSTYGCKPVVSACQNAPSSDFCPGGKDYIIVTGTDANGCSIYGCKPKPSCQNAPSSDFCPGGKDYIIVTGTDANGCSTYGCKPKPSCQNAPSADFCPGGKGYIIVTGTDANGCSTYGCKPESNCQNFPSPSFCLGGTDYIIVNGTDANGCSTYACKPEPTCQNAPSANFCPGGKEYIIRNGTDHNGCATYGCKPKLSCQNFPSPSFCLGGTDYIIVNGTDANGCSTYGCRSHIIEHYIVIDETATTNDITIANSLQTYLINSFGTDNMSFPIKYRSNISKKDLDGRVTTFIYDGKALIINDEISYGIIIKNNDFLKGRPAITEYLSGNIGILAIPRNNSELIYDDLRKEMYKNCKNAGEPWQVLPSNRYNVCCQGLDFVSVANIKDGQCGTVPEYRMCSNCGNGVCESWENVCNCKEDCEISKDSKTIIDEILNKEDIKVITSENLSIIDSKVLMHISSGSSKEINYMPEELYDVLNINSIRNVELNEESEKAIYSIDGTKKERLLLIFPINTKIKAKVDAETGEIISFKRPWWGFLADS